MNNFKNDCQTFLNQVVNSGEYCGVFKPIEQPVLQQINENKYTFCILTHYSRTSFICEPREEGDGDGDCVVTWSSCSTSPTDLKTHVYFLED